MGRSSQLRARTAVLRWPPFAPEPKPARGPVEPGNARPDTAIKAHRRRPARPRAAERPPRAGDRTRVEGPGPPLGPQPPPDVLVPRELPRVAGPCLHRALYAAGRRRPRPLQRTRHGTAPGDRRGSDRRRQRPQPAGARPDGREAGARDPGGGANPSHGPASRLGRRRAGLDGARPAGEVAPRPPLGPGPDGGLRSWPGRPRRSPSRTRSRSRSTRGPWRRSCSCARTCGPTTARTGSSQGALAGILHGKTPSYLSTIMPNTFSMAPRYVCDYVARTGYEPPARDAFDALAAKLDRLYRQPLPTAPGIALHGDARTAGRRARAALRARGLPDRARLVVTSPPYLRVLKYGYYNWLRTWLLGFDARRHRRRAGRRPPPRAVPRVPARGPRRPPPGPDRRRDRGRGHRRRRDGPRQALGRGDRPRGACLGGGGAARGLPAGRRRPRRGGREPQDDPPVGRAGRAGDEDGPDPGARCRRRRGAGEPWPPPICRSTGIGRRRGCARSEESRPAASGAE